MTERDLPVPVPPEHGPPEPASRRSKARVALLVALAADALQIVLLPAMLGGALSPVVDVIDVVTAIAMISLLGWHWAFLPAFVAEMAPFLDLVPTWTLAVLLVTRDVRKR